MRKDYTQRPSISEVWHVIQARFPYSEKDEDQDYRMIDYFDKAGELVRDEVNPDQVTIRFKQD